MDDIREQVLATLSQQGTLSSLKAQLRAAVFAAISETTTGQTARCERRDWLLGTEEGLSVAALVRDFLVWCELFSTAKVFDAEMDIGEELGGRTDVAHQLLLNSDDDQPLLLTILQAFLQQMPDPSASLQVQFGTFKHEEVENSLEEEEEASHYRAETDQKAQAISQRESREEAFIKAVHSPLLSPRLENPAEDNDANSESTKATSAEKYGRKLEREGLQLDLDDPSSLRSHPTRISDLGELSPSRRSVEELKRQLQSQGLLLTSPLQSPERPRSARTDTST